MKVWVSLEMSCNVGMCKLHCVVHSILVRWLPWHDSSQWQHDLSLGHSTGRWEQLLYHQWKHPLPAAAAGVSGLQRPTWWESTATSCRGPPPPLDAEKSAVLLLCEVRKEEGRRWRDQDDRGRGGRWVVMNTYHIAGNFWGRKPSWIFAVLRLFVKVFSAKFGDVATFGVAHT